MRKHIHVEEAGAEGRFIDIFPHETNLFCVYEMWRNASRHLTNGKLYIYIYAYIRDL